MDLSYNKWLVLLIATPIAILFTLLVILYIDNFVSGSLLLLILVIEAFLVCVASIHLMITSLFKKDENNI